MGGWPRVRVSCSTKWCTLVSVEYKTFISAAKWLKLLPWVDIDLGYVENVEKKMF